METPLLIGLNGFKGTGKDTVGQILVEHHGFTRYAFADKLKEAAGALWDVNPSLWDMLKDDPNCKVAIFDQEIGDGYSEMTVRKFLQRFGTEMGRLTFGTDFWVDQVLPFKEFSTALADNRYHGNRVFTDARFGNELTRIKDLGGFNIQIIRPEYGDETHASEQEPPEWMIDARIVNDATVEDLHDKVVDVLNQIHYFLSETANES